MKKEDLKEEIKNKNSWTEGKIDTLFKFPNAKIIKTIFLTVKETIEPQ